MKKFACLIEFQALEKIVGLSTIFDEDDVIMQTIGKQIKGGKLLCISSVLGYAFGQKMSA
ncbi:hypothetical protein [Scytonema sp. PRP1]|uniref:hypothetical protein n=1 Tax=Scytonema sp. PRP1 TaxID=3120513 RepID=UPI002FCF9AE4